MLLLDQGVVKAEEVVEDVPNTLSRPRCAVHTGKGSGEEGDVFANEDFLGLEVKKEIGLFGLGAVSNENAFVHTRATLATRVHWFDRVSQAAKRVQLQWFS